MYPVTSAQQLDDQSQRLLGDSMFGMPAWYAAQAHARSGAPVWLYFFTRLPPSPDQTAGAYHAAEIGFVFGTNELLPFVEEGPQDAELTRQMGDYWVQLARTGNPNLDGVPNWPKFSEQNQQQMVFGPPTAAAAEVSRLVNYRALAILIDSNVQRETALSVAPTEQ